MPSDINEPTTPTGSTEPPVPPHEPAGGGGRDLPPSLSTSSSGDDLTLSLTHARPDPLLGGFDTGPGPASGEPPGAAPGARDQDPAARADAINALSGLDVTATDPSVAPLGQDLASSTSGTFATLNLASPPPHPAEAERTRADAARPVDEEEDGDEEPPRRGTPLTTMLLASYASAVTLGLVWVLWTGRRVRESPTPDFLPPADSRPDPGRRADRSRRLVTPPPVAAEHLTTLGKTVRLGLIEVTPVSVTSGRVVLERNVVKREMKAGGDGALKLRLRLRNTSAETVLAPLDEAFLRERVNADPDSFIETSGGGPSIAMFPLALESEWSIAGQEFRELKPGEVLETVVVSAPEARARVSAEMTWRVRLRTDLNHTDDLGVRFRADQIVAGR